MSIEAMKQALEALEKLWDIIDDIDTYGDMAKSDDKLYRSLVERRQRQRFEQTGISTDGYELNGGVITSLRQAIAEAEKQEPVAVVDSTISGDIDWLCTVFPKQGTKLYTHPQPNVTTSDMKQEHVDKTAKQRHEWVGLTVMEAVELELATNHPREFAAAIEAKLKDKNGF